MERCLWLGGRSVSAELPALCGKCLGGVGGGACETPRKQHSSGKVQGTVQSLQRHGNQSTPPIGRQLPWQSPSFHTAEPSEGLVPRTE